MTLDNLNPATVFAPFKSALGNHFPAICEIAKRELGRVAKDVKSTQGGWKCSDKGILTSKEGHKLALPLNNPLWILVRFGMQLSDIASKGDFDGNYEVAKDGTVIHVGVEAGIPRQCEDWLQQFVKAQKAKATEAEIAAVIA